MVNDCLLYAETIRNVDAVTHEVVAHVGQKLASDLYSVLLKLSSRLLLTARFPADPDPGVLMSVPQLRLQSLFPIGMQRVSMLLVSDCALHYCSGGAVSFSLVTAVHTITDWLW